MPYLTRFFATAALILLLACAINWLVDPFGRYWAPVIPGINETKPASGNRVRVTKAYRATDVAPEVLIVGNSRAEMGLFPGHATLSGRRTYNQAMPGAGIAMQTDYALNTLQTTPELTRVIMGVDFLDFLVRRDRLSSAVDEPASRDYQHRLQRNTPGLQGRLFRLREQATLLFSLSGLLASAGTVAQQGAQVNSIGPDGFNTPGAYLAILQHEGLSPLFVQKLEELDRNLGSRDLVVFDPASARHSPAFGILEAFLAELGQQGVTVQLFISPYHYSYLQLLDDLGYRQDYLLWKRQLTALAEAAGARVELWDFSGPSDYVTEAVTPGSHQAMRWYWEPAHYRRTLGDKIMETLSGGGSPDFGRKLTRAALPESEAGDIALLTDTRADWLALQSALGLRLSAAGKTAPQQPGGSVRSKTGTR